MKDIELCTEQITIFSINIPMNIIYILLYIHICIYITYIYIINLG